MKFLVVLASVLVLAAAYEPSGWKPQGARLTLPTEYGAPAQAQPQDVEVEITKENLEYVGQLGETEDPTTTEQPNNEYLPPTTTEVPEEAPEETTDPLTTQQLPERDNSRSFHEQPKRVGELRRMPLRFQKQFARLEQQQQPQDTYGPPPAPTTTVQPEVESEVEVATQENFNAPEEIETETEDEIPEASIAVANSGQYYILAPDNTLQRVTFYTRQTEDDRRSNGFTAELRYAPVEPIRDPIYAYNQQGQLVKVYNN